MDNQEVQVIHMEDGDILVVYVDTDAIKFDKASQIVRGFQQMFPDNKVIGLPLNATFVEKTDKETLIGILEDHIEYLKGASDGQ